MKNTQKRVNEIIDQMCQGKHIDDVTKTWLSQTPNSLRIPMFYKLTKIHIPILVGRLLISGCDCPTERISSFVETLPQTMTQLQHSYLKDATAFLNFIEKTKVGKDTILVSMNVSSLYTNIPQEEGTNILCEAYEKLNYFHLLSNSRPKYQRTKSRSSIPQCLKERDSQNPTWTSKPITSRPRPSNLRTSPRATHRA